MNYDAQKFYNAELILNNASDLLSELDTVLEDMEGTGFWPWTTDFVYENELEGILDDIFAARSECTSICNVVTECLYVLCGRDADFASEYAICANGSFSQMSVEEQEQNKYLIEYNKEEVVRKLNGYSKLKEYSKNGDVNYDLNIFDSNYMILLYEYYNYYGDDGSKYAKEFKTVFNHYEMVDFSGDFSKITDFQSIYLNSFSDGYLNFMRKNSKKIEGRTIGELLVSSDPIFNESGFRDLLKKLYTHGYGDIKIREIISKDNGFSAILLEDVNGNVMVNYNGTEKSVKNDVMYDAMTFLNNKIDSKNIYNFESLLASLSRNQKKVEKLTKNTTIKEYSLKADKQQREDAEALTLFLMLEAQNKNTQLYFNGFSLGGSLAEYSLSYALRDHTNEMQFKKIDYLSEEREIFEKYNQIKKQDGFINDKLISSLNSFDIKIDLNRFQEEIPLYQYNVISKKSREDMIGGLTTFNGLHANLSKESINEIKDLGKEKVRMFCVQGDFVSGYNNFDEYKDFAIYLEFDYEKMFEKTKELLDVKNSEQLFSENLIEKLKDPKVKKLAINIPDNVLDFFYKNQRYLTMLFQGACHSPQNFITFGDASVQGAIELNFDDKGNYNNSDVEILSPDELISIAFKEDGKVVYNDIIKKFLESLEDFNDKQFCKVSNKVVNYFDDYYDDIEELVQTIKKIKEGTSDACSIIDELKFIDKQWFEDTSDLINSLNDLRKDYGCDEDTIIEMIGIEDKDMIAILEKYMKLENIDENSMVSALSEIIEDKINFSGVIGNGFEWTVETILKNYINNKSNDSFVADIQEHLMFGVLATYDGLRDK